MEKVNSEPQMKPVEPESDNHTGEGFMDYNELINIVAKYQQRHKLCEDVDYMEQISAPNSLYDKLQTSLETGIRSDSLEARIRAFGTNQPPLKKIKGFCLLLLEALNDLTLIVLIAASVISTLINWFAEPDHRDVALMEGAAILMAVAVSSGIQAINDHQKEKQFRILNDAAMAAKKVTVLRDGIEVEIQLSLVLVGDIVNVVAGDEVAGDAILLKGSSVITDEASMTGESDVLIKEPVSVCIAKREKVIEEGQANTAGHHEVPSPVLLSGTNIKNGTGKMMVVAVGNKSAIGKVRKTIVESGGDETPLQKKLDKIARDVGLFGLVVAIFTFIAIIIRSMIDLAGQDWKWSNEITELLVDGFVTGILIVVVAIPEGLPLAVTLSLAFSVKRMLKDKNLVRKLHACETMGGANVICSDKTGTLTMNKMYLTHFWNQEARQIYNYENGEVVNCTEFIDESQLEIFEQSICCNSSADPDKESGNPTELAMVRYIKSCGNDVMATRKRFEVLEEEPFSSDRKRMSTLIKNSDNRELMLIKGASELVVQGCETILNLQTGEVTPIDEDVRAEIINAITQFAEKSLRTIGLAYSFPDKYDKDAKDKNGVLDCERQGLTLIGVCGIKDVIRPEVPGAIKKCRGAGVEVKMVTGDNKITARAIALECGIIERLEEGEFKEFQVMLGKEFFEYVGGYEVIEDKKGKKEYKVVKGDKFDKIYKHVQVLARSRPEDKLTMVVGLRERGNVVAVTGDGTNDAPALSKANVGFAMGVTGTEIAKQAADILITDDNFNSIVSAVKWGRNIYDSIRKFIQFQLTVNVVSCLCVLISAAITKESVFSAVQMLWVNLIMDTLASLALATEAPTDALLTRPPIHKDSSIVSKKMAKHVIGQSVYQLIVVNVFLFLGTKFLPEEISDNQRADGTSDFICSGFKDDYDVDEKKESSRHYTYIFNVFVMMTVFNFVNARKLEDEFNIFSGVCDSFYFPVIVVMIFVLQILLMTFAGQPVGIAKWGLGIIGWCICLFFGFIGLLWRLVLRVIPEDKMCFKFGSKQLSEKDKKRFSSLSLHRSVSRKFSHRGKYN